jgi:hypothetical protein
MGILPFIYESWHVTLQSVDEKHEDSMLRYGVPIATRLGAIT